MSRNTVGGGSWLVHSFTTIVRFQATFEKLENELREVNQNAEALKRNYLELTELKHILRKTQGFFDEVSVKLELLLCVKKPNFMLNCMYCIQFLICFYFRGNNSCSYFGFVHLFMLRKN